MSLRGVSPVQFRNVAHPGRPEQRKPAGPRPGLDPKTTKFVNTVLQHEELGHNGVDKPLP